MVAGLIRVAVRFFSGVPHPHLLGVCCPNRLYNQTANEMDHINNMLCNGLGGEGGRYYLFDRFFFRQGANEM